MKEKNKGFTLIELLAVIVILAIIALIATPIVMNLISKARKSAAEDSAYGMVKAAESYYAGTLLETSGNGISSDLKFSCTKDGCKIDEDKELTFNGTKPSSGTITIKPDGKVQIKDLVINNYKCNYKENSTEIECLSSGEIFANDIVIKGDDGLDIGEKMTLSAIITPEETTNKNVIWTSSDENVATVDENGVVTGVGSGEVTITATTANGKMATKLVKVLTAFESDDWATIVKNVKEGNDSAYKVGDTKTVNMGSFGSHTLRIANISKPSECNNYGFSQTACGFVIEFADIITTHVMNSSQTNVGGWPASEMRTYVNNDIYNALPADLRNGIIETTVVSGHGYNDSSNFTSTDKLYLLSTAEVWAQGSSNTIDYDTARGVTRQLDYYASLGVTTSNYSGAIKNYNGSANFWWLRSGYSVYNDGFYFVSSNGERFTPSAYNACGVSPAFRLK